MFLSSRPWLLTVASLLLTSTDAFAPPIKRTVLAGRAREIMTSSSSAMAMVDPASFPSAAVGFFGGVRIPASLIAGSSVACLFALIPPARQLQQDQSSFSQYTHLERFLLRTYHGIVLWTFCLSLTTIITTTTASTSLLLGHYNSKAYTDVYHFLRGELSWEFVLTRWSFLSSLLMFCASVATRLILELDLLKPNRTSQSFWVVGTLVGFLAGIIATVNETLNCWPNLGLMTWEVIVIVGQRAWQTRKPMYLLSSAAFGGTGIWILREIALWLKSVSTNPQNDEEKLMGSSV